MLQSGNIETRHGLNLGTPLCPQTSIEFVIRKFMNSLSIVLKNGINIHSLHTIKKQFRLAMISSCDPMCRTNGCYVCTRIVYRAEGKGRK